MSTSPPPGLLGGLGHIRLRSTHRKAVVDLTNALDVADDSNDLFANLLARGGARHHQDALGESEIHAFRADALVFDVLTDRFVDLLLVVVVSEYAFARCP